MRVFISNAGGLEVHSCQSAWCIIFVVELSDREDPVLLFPDLQGGQQTHERPR